MKKHLFLGIMGAAVFFNSCSSNDENEPTEKKILLSKVTTTYSDPIVSFLNGTLTLEYNSKGQLIKMQSKEGTSIFEYKNGKPIKSNDYNSQQQLESYSEFNYSGDQLVSNKIIYTNSENNRTHQYAYNAVGQLSSYTSCRSVNCSDPTKETYIYNGDNVSLHTLNFNETDLKTEYSYDNKFNPYTNTDKYLKISWGRNDILSKNNCIISKSDSQYSGKDITTYNLEYNSAGFPTRTIGKSMNGEPFVQYDYEYITL
ncbi:hypothetical protein [Chryseobacterium sp. BIGb0232]|uniref:hypothetical protein n=1 Tax=Chryseobacterium sp. BIGb0232 TaxID=2940598 RepID=UPI000F4802B7|nr:hypothetical protein [Chryseobacterium sp. BIGb0232]MCS4301294.1 YD repeat-containing protein [Chryseobacterium sp. BIGb0232]ROS19846.1 YD repeat-containing protein [Chryseobacterium nakagawai]